MLQNVDIVTVKDLLGHKEISTTMRYAHPTDRHKRWAVDMLNLTDPRKKAEKAPEVRNSVHTYCTIDKLAKSHHS